MCAIVSFFHSPFHPKAKPFVFQTNKYKICKWKRLNVCLSCLYVCARLIVIIILLFNMKADSSRLPGFSVPFRHGTFAVIVASDCMFIVIKLWAVPIFHPLSLLLSLGFSLFIFRAVRYFLFYSNCESDEIESISLMCECAFEWVATIHLHYSNEWMLDQYI